MYGQYRNRDSDALASTFIGDALRQIDPANVPLDSEPEPQHSRDVQQASTRATLKRALAIFEAAYGPEHSYTPRAREDLQAVQSRGDGGR